jgi:hypothetical protein
MSDSKDQKTENPTLGVLEEDDEFEEFAVAGEYYFILQRPLDSSVFLNRLG